MPSLTGAQRHHLRQVKPAGPTTAQAKVATQVEKKYVKLIQPRGRRDQRGAVGGALGPRYRRRISIARAFAIEPKMLLFDEPYSAPSTR